MTAIKVKDAKAGELIEVFCYAAGPPHNQYQVATYQPLKNPGVPHDGEPWRKIRVFKGQDVKFLHPLNDCRVLKGKTKEQDNDTLEKI